MLLAVSLITFTCSRPQAVTQCPHFATIRRSLMATIEELRKVYGLDRSFFERYGTWAASAVRGDLANRFV